MELTPLRYFLKTAETLNYTRAAEELFTSRQALCHTLSNLEKELGQPLFVNDRNHLSLTEYGEYLLQAFREPVQAFEEREAQVKEFFRRPIRLDLVLATSMIPYFLPAVDQLLYEFKQKHPCLILEPRQLPDDQAIEAIEKERTDCGCILRMAQPDQQPNCTAAILRTFPVAIGSGPLSPLYQKSNLTLEELSSVSLISMGDPARVARPLWEDCIQRGLSLNYQVVPNVIDAIYLMQTTTSSGFTIFSPPDHRIVSPPNSYTAALLPGYTWEVAALCPKSRPNLAAALLLAQFLREKYAVL